MPYRRPRLLVLRITALAVALVLSAALLEAGFSDPVEYPAGDGPTFNAVGDFNRDGVPDLAVLSPPGNTLSILLGNGDGTFQAPVAYAAGGASNEPVAVTVSDLNNDGKPDLVVANRFSAGISVFLGNGDGTLAARVGYAAGTEAVGVVTGDLNGDGSQDVAVANRGSQDVSVLLGTGTGTLLPAVSYPAASPPTSIAVADLNRDGRLDLAMPSGFSSDISMLLGNGDGTFQPWVRIAAANFLFRGTVGDFNEDGRPDLVALGGRAFVILLGNGDGTFQAPVSYDFAPSASGIEVADFDMDGHQDLAITGYQLHILRGTGTGTFGTPTTYGNPTYLDGLATGDFNRDGRIDVVVANRDADSVRVLLNEASATLCTMQPAVSYAFVDEPRPLGVGDFDRDGNPDLAVLDGSRGASILLGDRNGTFHATATYPTGNGSRSIIVDDFNRDGKPDIATANSTAGEVSILLGDGHGAFQTTNVHVGSFFSLSLAAGDFDQDGKPDLVVANDDFLGTTNVTILRGVGDGTFTSVGSYAVGATPLSVAAGDLNRDGRLDLAVANYSSNNVAVLLGNGNATFQSATFYPAGPALAIAFGDYDRDGRPDVAVTGSNAVTVLLGNGDGTVQAGINSAAGTSTVGLAVSDFDLDGTLDLAVADDGSASVSVLLGTGNGSFQSPAHYTAGPRVRFVAAADFNHDGKPDLAAVNDGPPNTASAYLNSCRLIPSTKLASSRNPSPVGHSVTFTATVTLDPAGADVPTGTVTFKDGATTLGTGILMNGTATYTAPALSLGNHPITAAYGGDATFPANTSPVLTQMVLPPVDLSITKADGQSFATPGSSITYTIVAANAGSIPAPGATVTDIVPVALQGAAWSCVGSGGGTCTANGSGSIADTVDLPVGASVTYSLTGTIAAAAMGTLSNTATAAPPSTLADLTPQDNTATDADAIMACGSEVVVVPDGRPTSLVAPPGVPLWFLAYLRIGGSYTVEVHAPDGSTSPETLTVFAGDDQCGSPSTLAPRDTSAVDAQGTAVARASFVAPGAATLFRARLVNNSGSPIPIQFSWAETTLYSAAWSSNGAFDTLYSFQNTTSATLQGRLVLTDTTGTVVATSDLVIPPGRAAATNTLTLAVPRGFTGTATFAHDGPPGAILASAAIASFATTPSYVQPVKFVPMRDGR